MIPPTHDIQIYQGDSFGDGWTITLPDLSSRGGPADLAGAALSAQVRKKPGDPILAEFDVEVLDAVGRRIRPKLTPTQTAALTLPDKGGVWDLQVEYQGWVGTVLRGSVALYKEVTKPEETSG